MGIGSFFKKVGSKIGGGVIAGGKVVADIADIPGVAMGVAMIPAVGPLLALAMDKVDRAERLFSDRTKSGTDKMGWAVGEMLAELNSRNVDAKRVKGLLELALLLKKHEAVFVDAPDLVKQIISGKAA